MGVSFARPRPLTPTRRCSAWPTACILEFVTSRDLGDRRSRWRRFMPRSMEPAGSCRRPSPDAPSAPRQYSAPLTPGLVPGSELSGAGVLQSLAVLSLHSDTDTCSRSTGSPRYGGKAPRTSSQPIAPTDQFFPTFQRRPLSHPGSASADLSFLDVPERVSSMSPV